MNTHKEPYWNAFLWWTGGFSTLGLVFAMLIVFGLNPGQNRIAEDTTIVAIWVLIGLVYAVGSFPYSETRWKRRMETEEIIDYPGVLNRLERWGQYMSFWFWPVLLLRRLTAK